MNYYLYRHVRLDKNTPFYIGIGKKPSRIRGYSDEYKRALDKNGRNVYWKRIVAKTKYNVDILYECNDLAEIREKEIEFIELYKRICDGGCLCNLTKGGESTAGYKHSIETRIKYSERAKLINPTKGKKLTKEHRNKISESHRGMKCNKEVVEKMKLRGKKIFCIETNTEYSNGTDVAKRIFNSDKRYYRMAICRAIRNNITFKNYTFRWVVE